MRLHVSNRRGNCIADSPMVMLNPGALSSALSFDAWTGADAAAEPDDSARGQPSRRCTYGLIPMGGRHTRAGRTNRP